MITPEEENYLKTIPESKMVFIKPYDPNIKAVTEKIIDPIQNAFPELQILHMGTSGLGISGQNDIDIYILCERDKFNNYLPQLEKILGKPKSINPNSIAWEFEKEEYEVECYLTDPDSPSMQRQIKVYEILRSNESLLKEYEELKEKFNGKSYRSYQRAKYEFYNRILNS